MLSSTFTTALLVALAAAQSSTTSSNNQVTVTVSQTQTSTSTRPTSGIPSIIADIPSCAFKCLQSAAKDIGCDDAADFRCYCKGFKTTEYVAKIGLCIGINNHCDISDTTSDINDICDRVDDNPSDSEMSSASSYMDNAVQTAKSNPAARPTAAPLGAMGAAAAIAMLAL